MQNNIMCRTAGSQDARVAQEEKIKLNRTRDMRVDDHTSRTIPAFSFAISCVLGEEANVMSLGNNNECNLRADVEGSTGGYESR